MLPDTGNSVSDRWICLSYHCCYWTDHIIMYLDIIMTIMILVYLPAWGSLATWPLYIFAWVLELLSLSANGSMEKLMQIKMIKETWCQFKLTSRNRQSLLSRSNVCYLDLMGFLRFLKKWFVRFVVKNSDTSLISRFMRINACGNKGSLSVLRWRK